MRKTAKATSVCALALALWYGDDSGSRPGMCKPD